VRGPKWIKGRDDPFGFGRQRAGLVDELNLPVHPIIVGTGQRLFEDGGVQIPLTLAQAATFSTGVAQKA
jgi:RibD C-terminal domain